MMCKEELQAKIYLKRFNEILDTMAKRMLTAPVTNNITIDFIECMIPHHQAAIYMSQNLLDYTNYEPLEKIANNIIEMQTKGIKQMEEVYRTTTGFNNLYNDVVCYNRKYFSIVQNMICRMKNSLRSNNINLNFVNEMIPHHEGAISMCENLLKYCIDSRLKQVAESIIEEQSKGVKELEEVKNSIKYY